MRRIIGLSIITMLFLVSASGTALAGGWVVVTLDELPNELVAGNTYTFGYMIRAHGVTPVDLESTSIVARADGGPTLAFPGESGKTTGHYTAEVTIPQSGWWLLEVSQGDFALQEMGKLNVVSGAAPTSPGATIDTLRAILPVAMLLAVLTLAAQVLATVRRNENTATPDVA